jgi:hypothetical protein
MDWGINPSATITFTDLLAFCSNQFFEPLENPEGNGDQVWFRFNRILNELVNESLVAVIPPSLRSVDAAVGATMYGTRYDGDLLSLLQTTADCGPARLFADRSGLLTLLALDGGTDLDLELTDDPSDTNGIGYDLIEVTPGARYLTNQVSIQKVNGLGNTVGDPVTAADGASVTLYGVAGKQLTLPSNAAAPLAEAYAYQFSTPLDRVTRTAFSMVGLGSNFPKVLATDLADYVTITRTTYDERTVTFTCTVEGIEHDITPESWRMTILPGTQGVATAGAWAQTLTSASSGFGRDVEVGEDGLIYLAGQHNSKGYVVCLSSSGEIQWQRQLTSTAGATFQRARAVAGAVYAVGYGDDTSEDRALLVKYNDAGTLQWQRTLAGNITSRLFGVTVDSVGDVVAVGLSSGTGFSDGVVVKYDDAGAIQWQRSLGTSDEYTYLYGVAVDGDDNVIVCGSTSISTTDALLAKYDSTGTLLWQRTFGDVRVDIFETPVIDGDGNI